MVVVAGRRLGAETEHLVLPFPGTTPPAFFPRLAAALPLSQEEESLAHQVKCFENTPQASQVKLVAAKVQRKFYLEPLRRNALWSQRHDARDRLPAGTPLDQVGAGGWADGRVVVGRQRDPGMPCCSSWLGYCAGLNHSALMHSHCASNSNHMLFPACARPLALQLPLTMPCLDFVLTWHTNPQKPPVVSFWKPLPPAGARRPARWQLLPFASSPSAHPPTCPAAAAGYRATGDVLALGLEPPAAPVPCFRDDVALRIRCGCAVWGRVLCGAECKRTK